MFYKQKTLTQKGPYSTKPELSSGRFKAVMCRVRSMTSFLSVVYLIHFAYFC